MYGRPGDNPINDIIKHRLSIFGEPFDELIRQIGNHQYYGMVKKELEALCVKYMHAAPASEEEREAFNIGLRALIKTLDN